MSETTKTTEKTIEKILNDLGVSHNLKGRQCLKEAVLYCYNSDRSLYNIKFTKSVYPSVAETLGNGNTSSRVERSIRHAITVSFERADEEFKYLLFGNTYSQKRGRPTNCEYISAIVGHIKYL